MVCKIQNSHPSMAGTLEYNHKKVGKEVARIVGTFNIGDESLYGIERTFADYEMRNIRSERVSFQMSINPNPAIDGESLSDDEVMNFALELMEGLGYGKQPISIYEHKDIQRTHYHVVSIRTNEKGKKIRDFREELILQKMMKKFQKKYHFAIGNNQEESVTLAEAPVRFDRKKGHLREQYLKIFEEALTWRFTTFTQFQTIMASRGIDVAAIDGENWTLQFQGVDATSKKDSHMINEKKLGVECYSRYEKRARECASQKVSPGKGAVSLKEEKQRIALAVDECIACSLSESHLRRMLEAEGIHISFSVGANGSVFGVTVADEHTHMAFKGSDIGTSLSAKTFNELKEREQSPWNSSGALKILSKNDSKDCTQEDIKSAFPDIDNKSLLRILAGLRAMKQGVTTKRTKKAKAIEFIAKEQTGRNIGNPKKKVTDKQKQ